jgi:hypothetical protein
MAEEANSAEEKARNTIFHFSVRLVERETGRNDSVSTDFFVFLIVNWLRTLREMDEKFFFGVDVDYRWDWRILSAS